MNKFFAIFALTLLTGCLAEPPVQPIKIGMHVNPENETLVQAAQKNYFPIKDVHIVEAPSGLDMMLALRSGALDGAALDLASVINYSAQGIHLTIVAVINGTNEYSFPARGVDENASRIDSESYNVIAVRSDFLLDHPQRVGQLVLGWQRIRRETPPGGYNFTDFNGNKKLLLVDNALSLHRIIRRRSEGGTKAPGIDGRFFDNFAKDAGEAQ